MSMVAMRLAACAGAIPVNRFKLSRRLSYFTRLINSWRDQGAAAYWYDEFKCRNVYNIELHYYEHEGNAVCRLRWSYPGQSTQTVSASQLYPST